MRTPIKHVAADKTVTYRVRYRQAGTQTSQTFRRKQDAQTFAAILAGDDGVAEALAWLEARHRAHETPALAEYLEHYIAQMSGVTARTKADYRAQYRRYLSSIGALPVSLITKSHVVGIVNDMDAAGLSRKTIKNVIHMLSSVMALAVDEGHISRNPCRRVRLPQVRVDADIEPHFLTQEEAGQLIAAMPEHWRPLVTFLFGTGLRWSEATALEARHIDIQAGTVRVRQAWKYVPPDKAAGVKSTWELGPPKTEKANRTVNAAVPALVAVAPLLRKPRDLVFVTTTGRAVSHSNFYNRIWKPACVKAGLDPRPRIHDTRHSHASWLISDGASLEQVQDQLGHESILTTRKVYGALQPALGVEVGRLASAAMARALATVPAEIGH